MSNMQTISPNRAAEMVRAGAVLVDIREADEYAREHIPGARHHALTRIHTESPARGAGDVLIFHCRSGVRTQGNAPKLQAAAQSCRTYILDGGLEAWKKAGHPVKLDRNQPLDIMRQVQIAAGGMVLIGVVLGAMVAPEFYGLAGFVGAGLLFAGVSGVCGMARFLGAMPWNRRARVRT